jgi:phosphoenolpyruvate carboxylase
MVLAVTGHRTLLGNRRALRTAIALRAPAVDALGFLQLRFLSERDGDPVVQVTVTGLGAGLQNTG